MANALSASCVKVKFSAFTLAQENELLKNKNIEYLK
jgi:hypothetical protein